MGRGRRRVEVVKGNDGLELLVDGTFASLYLPGCPITGSVWDAIAAPVLALPPERRRRVLLLGVAGGSAARVIRAIAPDAKIVGVEFDAEVVAVARRDFDLDSLDLELVVADARDFLREDDRLFDVVIDDVFVGDGDDVHKPDWLPDPGHTDAARRVDEGGLLVSNTLDEAPNVARALHQLFPRLVQIEIDDYDNKVIVAGPEWLSARRLRREVAADPLLGTTLERLTFRKR